MVTFIATRWSVNTDCYGQDADVLFGLDRIAAEGFADEWSLSATPYWSA